MSLKQRGSGVAHSKGSGAGRGRWRGLTAVLGIACMAAPWAIASQQGQNATQVPPPPEDTPTSQAAPPPQNPALHKRSAAQPDEVTSTPVVATGHSNLPPEAEGDYPWDKLGGVIDLYFEDGKLHGYMTEHLDPDRHAAPATYDFATTHVDGHAVAWTTRVVHATSYSFSGHLERGLVASPALPGYYLLTGTLTEHGGDADGFARTVSLKRQPGEQ